MYVSIAITEIPRVQFGERMGAGGMTKEKNLSPTREVWKVNIFYSPVFDTDNLPYIYIRVCVCDYTQFKMNKIGYLHKLPICNYTQSKSMINFNCFTVTTWKKVKMTNCFDLFKWLADE